MSFLTILFCLFFVFLASATLTGLIYRSARKRGWLAIPNERSSHTDPTPTGGGLAIAVVFLVSAALLGILGVMDREVSIALAGGGSMVAIVSWIDDRRALGVRERMLVHVFAALWVLWHLGGLESVNIGFTAISLGRAGDALAVLWIVGLSNLYNFMDGLDGLLGAETVVVGAVAGMLLVIGGRTELALLAWILAAGAAGFLMWNWHPAKIFMGDVGSVLIGFSFATLALVSERANAVPILVWILLLLIVVIDAGMSTLRRAVKGEKWFEAHRTFGYHRALERGLNHAQVSARVMVLNSIVVAGAFVSFFWPTFLLPILGVSFTFLSWLWWLIQKRSLSPGPMHTSWYCRRDLTAYSRYEETKQ